jgi:hypothetical protein
MELNASVPFIVRMYTLWWTGLMHYFLLLYILSCTKLNISLSIIIYLNKYINMQGVVVSGFASGIEYRGFESHQGLRILYIAMFWFGHV